MKILLLHQFIILSSLLTLFLGEAAKFRHLGRNIGGSSIGIGIGNHRRLDGDGNYGNDDFDFSGYSLQYTGCSAVKVYDDENAGNSDTDTVLSTHRMVTFRLCPTTTGSGGGGGCKNGNNGNGCGEYVTTLERFLNGIYGYEINRMSTLCQQCQECASLEKQHEQYEEKRQYEIQQKQAAIQAAQANYAQFQQEYYSSSNNGDGSSSGGQTTSSNNSGGSGSSNNYSYQEQGEDDTDDTEEVQIAYYDKVMGENHNDYAAAGQYDNYGGSSSSSNNGGSDNDQQGSSSNGEAYGDGDGDETTYSDGTIYNGGRIVNGHYGYVDNGSGTQDWSFIQEWGYVDGYGVFVSLEAEDDDDGEEDVDTCDEDVSETCVVIYSACVQVLANNDEDTDVDELQEYYGATADEGGGDGDEQQQQQAAITIQDFLQCTLIDEADDELYLGPYCNDDNEITLAIYTDSDCSERATTTTTTVSEVLGITTDEDQQQQGNYNIVPSTDECVPCDSSPTTMTTGQTEAYADGDYEINGEVEGDIVEMCSYLYEVSGTCNKNINYDNNSFFSKEQDGIVCPYIESLKSDTYDEFGEVTFSTWTGGSSGNSGGSGGGGGGSSLSSSSPTNWKEFAMTKIGSVNESMDSNLKVGLAVSAFAAAAMAISAIVLHAMLARSRRRSTSRKGGGISKLLDDDNNNNDQHPYLEYSTSSADGKISSEGDGDYDDPNNTTLDTTFDTTMDISAEDDDGDNSSGDDDDAGAAATAKRSMLV